jgi:SAM-dependent methyltransferase
VASQAAGVPEGFRVLDVGAGRGPYRPLFNHCQYFTQDFGQELSTQGAYTKIDYASDITAIPVPDQSFDAILCTEVLEHIPNPFPALREMARILRPGGRIILTAPLGSLLHQEPYHFYGGYTPHWYGKFLPEFGFEIETIEQNQGFFSFFGQEALRFSANIDPRRLPCKGWKWVALSMLWLLTLPMLRGFFPLLGGVLDSLGLEQIATVGYHVVAVRK